MKYLYGREKPLSGGIVTGLGLQPVALVHGIGPLPSVTLLVEVTGWDDAGEPFIQCPRCARKVPACVWTEMGCTSDACLVGSIHL